MFANEIVHVRIGELKLHGQYLMEGRCERTTTCCGVIRTLSSFLLLFRAFFCFFELLLGPTVVTGTPAVIWSA